MRNVPSGNGSAPWSPGLDVSIMSRLTVVCLPRSRSYPAKWTRLTATRHLDTDLAHHNDGAAIGESFEARFAVAADELAFSDDSIGGRLVNLALAQRLCAGKGRHENGGENDASEHG